MVVESLENLLLAAMFEIGDACGVRRIASAVRRTTQRMNQVLVQLKGHSVNFGEHGLVRRTNLAIRRMVRRSSPVFLDNFGDTEVVRRSDSAIRRMGSAKYSVKFV